MGTGQHAKDVLLKCVMILFRLCEGTKHKVEYVRSLSIALLGWTPWHSHLLGCCCIEEFSEASLSLMPKTCQRHPRYVST